MPHVQISRREKTIAVIVALVLTVISSVWFGERFEPFGLTNRVANFASGQINAQIKKVTNEQPAPTPAPNKQTAPAPAPKPVPVPGQTYIAQKGDTVHAISKKFKVHPELLKFKNNIGSDNKIVAGQELIIPAKNGS